MELTSKLSLRTATQYSSTTINNPSFRMQRRRKKKMIDKVCWLLTEKAKFIVFCSLVTNAFLLRLCPMFGRHFASFTQIIIFNKDFSSRPILKFFLSRNHPSIVSFSERAGCWTMLSSIHEKKAFLKSYVRFANQWYKYQESRSKSLALAKMYISIQEFWK